MKRGRSWIALVEVVLALGGAVAAGAWAAQALAQRPRPGDLALLVIAMAAMAAIAAGCAYRLRARVRDARRTDGLAPHLAHPYAVPNSDAGRPTVERPLGDDCARKRDRVASVSVSDLIGRTVVDAQGQTLGCLDDLVVRTVGADPPWLMGIVVRVGREARWLPIDAASLRDAPPSHPIQVETCAALSPMRRDAEGGLALGHDLLDHEVIDLRRRRVVRVNEVVLDEVAGRWEIRGVVSGAGALLRRLLPAVLRSCAAAGHDRLLPWAAVDLLPRLDPDGVGSADVRRLAAFDGADLACIAAAAPIRQAGALLAALNDVRAAHALAGLPPGRLAPITTILGPTRAAALLNLLPSAAAVTVLTELAPAQAEALLERMEPGAAAVAQVRLSCPCGTAGGVLRAPAALVPAWLRAGEVATYRRGQRGVPDAAPLLVVVTDLRERRLLGVVDPRALVRADPEVTLYDLMAPTWRPVRPGYPLARIARLMAAQSALALPVTDDGGRLLGVVTRDDTDAALPRWHPTLHR